MMCKGLLRWLLYCAISGAVAGTTMPLLEHLGLPALGALAIGLLLGSLTACVLVVVSWRK
jgi:hypothetical protein